ncbi:MAG: long-chain fatty acid--CoA ligase [Mariprofundaceae bacterium]
MVDSTSIDFSSVNVCHGIGLAEKARCLSDLLLRSPSEWLESPMLRTRLDDGTWRTLPRVSVQHRVLRVAAWLQSKGVQAGDRVGILGHNSIEWLIADFAILRLGAVTVPAYFTDPAEAVKYVFNDAECKFVFVEPGEQAQKLDGFHISHELLRGDDGETLEKVSRDEHWDGKLDADIPSRSDLATLIYTSGTTGHPKGVMLTHDNLLTDVIAGLGGVPVFRNDVFLSFLPISHAFERTVGHFLVAACGSEIAYAEDVTTLMRDMPEVKPTVMISVPRLYEKIYAGVNEKMQQGPAVKRWLFGKAQALGTERFTLKQNGDDLIGLKAKVWGVLDHLVNEKLRAKMGGNLRLFISGGAALSPVIARFLLAADITVLPGYGLTETAPVLCVNSASHIKPDTVGPALPGVELKLADDGELYARGPMLMQGYWKNPKATAEVVDSEGWLHTGDIVEVDSDGFVKIIDRKKEIMVLSNGENVPPAVVEQCLTHDPCFLQALLVGENKPYLSALIVVDIEMLKACWQRKTRQALPQDWKNDGKVMSWLHQRINADTHELASFMQVKKFIVADEEWTQLGGLITPTLKLKRANILALYGDEITALYAGDV